MERRKTKDFWASLLFYLNITAWVLLVGILLLFHQAQPEFESFFDRFYHLKVRTDWDLTYLNYLVYIVSAGIVISICGLVLGRFRGRRNSDHHKAALITIGVMSLLMLLKSLSVL